MSIVSTYCTPKPIRTGLKSGSNPRIPMIYNIFRDKKFKSPFLTIHPENMTMILAIKKDFFQSKQYRVCTKSRKAFLSTVLKTHGAKPRTWENLCVKTSSQFDMNLTVVLKSTQKILFKFLTRFVKW